MFFFSFVLQARVCSIQHWLPHLYLRAHESGVIWLCRKWFEISEQKREEYECSVSVDLLVAIQSRQPQVSNKQVSMITERKKTESQCQKNTRIFGRSVLEALILLSSSKQILFQLQYTFNQQFSHGFSNLIVLEITNTISALFAEWLTCIRFDLIADTYTNASKKW